jgi:hypothetical protein
MSPLTPSYNLDHDSIAARRIIRLFAIGPLGDFCFEFLDGRDVLVDDRFVDK